MCRHTHSIDFALKFPHTDQPLGQKTLQTELPGHSKDHGNWPEKEIAKNRCLAIVTRRGRWRCWEAQSQGQRGLAHQTPAPKARGATKSPPEGRATGLSANSCGVCLALKSESLPETHLTRNDTSNNLGRSYMLEHMLGMHKALGSTPNTR